MFVQFRSWHLLDERVEHRAISHVEGIGIIYYRVTSIEHLHFCCRYHYIVEHLVCKTILPLHVLVGQTEIVLLAHQFQGVGGEKRLIIGMHHLDDARAESFVSFHLERAASVF